MPRTVDALREVGGRDDPLELRAVAAAVAEPPLLTETARSDVCERASSRRVVERYRAYSPDRRRTESGRTLRQGLGYTISVVVAATGDFALLEELAASGDADLCWIVRQNLGKSRLRPWPDELGRIARLLE